MTPSNLVIQGAREHNLKEYRYHHPAREVGGNYRLIRVR